MSKYLPTLLAALSAITVAVSPAIQAGLSHHPEAATIVASLYAIVAHLLPSPVAPKVQ